MAGFGRGVGLGIAIGVVATLAGSYVVKGSFWRYQGQIDGRTEVFSAIKKEFGTLETGVPYDGIIGSKDELMVAVRVNGVKTVRVTP